MNDTFQCLRARSISLSCATGHKPQTLRAAAKFNLREELTPEICSSVEILRTRYNHILDGPKLASTIVRNAEELRRNCSNAHEHQNDDYCQAIEIEFCVPVWSQIHFLDYFWDSYRWLTHFWRLPVLSAVVHLDEAYPNMHVLLSPTYEDSYLGSSPIDSKRVQVLSDDFIAEVGVNYGFHSLEPKIPLAIKRMYADQVLTSVRGLNLSAQHELLWPMIEKQIRKDPEPLLGLLSGGSRLGFSPIEV